MKKLCLLVFLAVPLLLIAMPQDTGPDGFKLWTAAALAPIVQSLNTKAASDPHHSGTERLADFDHEYFLLARREADGQAEWHENEVDVFFVQSGSATLIVGGTMPGAQTIAPHEQRADTIQGGTRHKLTTGDIVRIPARTPHQLLLDGAHDFMYFVVKIKGY